METHRPVAHMVGSCSLGTGSTSIPRALQVFVLLSAANRTAPSFIVHRAAPEGMERVPTRARATDHSRRDPCCAQWLSQRLYGTVRYGTVRYGTIEPTRLTDGTQKQRKCTATSYRLIVCGHG